MKKQNDLLVSSTKAEEKTPLREKTIHKSLSLKSEDLENIQLIKDKCLNQKVVLSDSHVVRLALLIAAELSETELAKASLKTPKVITGRPRGSCK